MPIASRTIPAAALAAFLSSTAFAAIEVHTISGRPDMIAGPEALIETSAPMEKFSATLNGQDVSKNFKPGKKAGTLIGRIDGLKIGKNTLEVKSSKGSAKLEITDYAIAGPVFSGPHQKPFVCQTEPAGLGAPLDDDCSIKTVISYVYKSTEAPAPGAGRGGRGPGGPNALPAGFKTFDPSAPRPSDIAKAETSDGKTVDYIVRRERGTINRAIYEIAMLHDPAQPEPDPWTTSPNWNGRLVYSFGGGCAAGFRQGLPGGAITDDFLSQGYAVAVSSLNVFGNNCDDVISSETMMMVKGHFVNEFGLPVHTIGIGGSGGAIQQYMMAQNYPGLLDGLLPQISFPDNAIYESVIDCSLLAHAFDSTKASWTDAQKTAVSGYSDFKTCTDSWMSRGQALSLANNQVKAAACNQTIPKALAFDPIANPTGARCDYFDDMVNVYGKDPKTHTARRALDNIGVQYGLSAFTSGKINFDQFVQLNEVIGGHDVDGNIVPTRDSGDLQALKITYQTGRIDTGGGSLSSIPILDTRNYLDGAANLHDRFRSMVTRARLKEANGTADNQVTMIFPQQGPAPLRPGQLAAMMNHWLDNIAADTSNSSTAVKVARDKPGDVVDACYTDQGERIVEPQTWNGDGRCNQLYPAHADPRIASGAPLTDEVLKCQLKPIVATDYTPALTAEQMAKMKTAFPQGVCDYTKPGVAQQHVEGAWRRY